MTAPTPPSEILDKAADQIERHGWLREDWYREPPGADPLGPITWTECRVCAGGGINAAAGLVPDYNQHDGTHEPVERAFIALAERVAPGTVSRDVDDAIAAVTIWNDNYEGRTAKEVVRELRAAAASEREAGR